MQDNQYNPIDNIEEFIPLLQETADTNIARPKKSSKSFFNSVMNKLSDEFSKEKANAEIDEEQHIN